MQSGYAENVNQPPPKLQIFAQFEEPLNITLCNKITRLKIWIFKDFSLLNTIGTSIFACKLGKTAKNAIEVGKNALLPFFWTHLTEKGGKGGPN